jgi:nucleotide-binding universal stress UspA family protein
MGKRVIVGLDSSDYSDAAVSVACERAKHYDGTVVGVAVVDRPRIERSSSPEPVGAGHHAKQTISHHIERAHETCDEALARFTEMCRAAGVAFETVKHEGRPRQCLCEEGMSGDLMVVGTRTHFTFGSDPEDPGDTLQRLLKARVVPVLAVPKTPPEVKRIIFPFDGSAEAARAMRMFTYQTPQSEIHVPVTLLHAGNDREEGVRLLQPPLRYLKAHRPNVDIRVELGSVNRTVLNVVKGLQPALVVLGASNKGPIEKLIFGGVTKALLEDGSVMMFISA